MKIILAILIVAAGWQAVAADGPKSAQQQKNQCENGSGKNTRSNVGCFAYMRGVQEEMEGELAWGDDAHTKLTVGNWQNGVTTEQLISVFVKYADANPAELNKPATAVFRRSVEAAKLYVYTPVTNSK